ncbi:XRE family transcriptional regulator [Catenuloplanes sp. NPDC051500]|uniref:XRE family transcriptional regulator n=1 Tax=Catenuloplanes sp. NPDC051500 TaxID=3363959 RepID=UPI0037AEDB10
MTSDRPALAAVGSRLRALRRARSVSLHELAAGTGVSSSALSRMENGHRKPTLAQLLPLARFYGLTLDSLIDPSAQARHVKLPAFERHGATYVQLSSQPGGIQVYRMTYQAPPVLPEPELCRHEGFLVLNVLAGRLRLVLGDRDLVLRAGETAEVDTSVPHGMAPADHQPIEALLMFGAQGERMAVAARTVRTPGNPHDRRVSERP